MDGLIDVFRIGAKQLCQPVAVQALIGVGLLLVHERAEAAEELLLDVERFFRFRFQLFDCLLFLEFELLNLFIETSVLSG